MSQVFGRKAGPHGRSEELGEVSLLRLLRRGVQLNIERLDASAKQKRSSSSSNSPNRSTIPKLQSQM